MSIAEKLTSIANTKTLIAQAIEEKGVTVGDVPFLQYPEKISEIPVVGEWARPAEWLEMPEVLATEDKFAALVAVYDNDWNYVELKVDGAAVDEYTVDWGDGTVEDFDYGVTAVHQYSFADTDLTDTSAALGYKQAMVVVTPKGSEAWTYFSLQEGEIPESIFRAPVNWLDIVFSGPNVTTLKLGLED
jgi:hypothetical protein